MAGVVLRQVESRSKVRVEVVVGKVYSCSEVCLGS